MDLCRVTLSPTVMSPIQRNNIRLMRYPTMVDYLRIAMVVAYKQLFQKVKMNTRNGVSPATKNT